MSFLHAAATCSFGLALGFALFVIITSLRNVRWKILDALLAPDWTD